MWKKKEFIQMTFTDQTGRQKKVRMKQFLGDSLGVDWQTCVHEFTSEGVLLDRKNQCSYLNCCQNAQHVELKRTSIFEVD